MTPSSGEIPKEKRMPEILHEELVKFIQQREIYGHKLTDLLADPMPDLRPMNLPTVTLTKEQYELHLDHYSLLLAFVSVITATPPERITTGTLADYELRQVRYVNGLIGEVEKYRKEFPGDLARLERRVYALEDHPDDNEDCEGCY